MDTALSFQEQLDKLAADILAASALMKTASLGIAALQHHLKEGQESTVESPVNGKKVSISKNGSGLVGKKDRHSASINSDDLPVDEDDDEADHLDEFIKSSDSKSKQPSLKPDSNDDDGHDSEIKSDQPPPQQLNDEDDEEVEKLTSKPAAKSKRAPRAKKVVYDDEDDDEDEAEKKPEKKGRARKDASDSKIPKGKKLAPKDKPATSDEAANGKPKKAAAARSKRDPTPNSNEPKKRRVAPKAGKSTASDD